MSLPLPAPVRVGDLAIGPGCPLLVIAGLCVLEEEESTLRQARAIAEALQGLPVRYVFKASFDKANRSSLHGWRGPGLASGLPLLRLVKETLGIPVLTDVHEPAQCGPVAEVADILQIPAFLCRQTDLLVAAARTGRMVNVKKGQFLAPWDVKPLVAKVRESGNPAVTVTERGSSFGYNTLVNDFRSLPLIRSFGIPVVFDATHSVQQPGGHGDRSGGDRSMVPYLALAAAAVGVDGVFFEVHEDPSRARSDKDNALPLPELGPLVRRILAVREAASSAV
jgi:2-dehydro-3-deoxyphosphooctonate aldolase (KDO 8-P synthase)